MHPKKPRLASIASIAPASLSPRHVASPAGRTDASARMKDSLGVFREECDAAIGRLRTALRALATATSSDPLRPQEVSRRFGINKNLTWKVARVLLAKDSFEAISMIPGPEGIEIYLRAFDVAGADGALSASVRDAMRTFDAVVARHFGDRAQLEMVLDGLRSDGNLESSRRMAFKGMAGVFGVQARARITAQILRPGVADPAIADIALIVGLAGIQRLRPIGALPMFRTAGNSAGGVPAPRPFIRSTGHDAPDYLLRDFSSYPDATVSAQPLDGGRFAIELSEGPIGRVGQADLFFATDTKAVMSLRPKAGDTRCSLVTSVSIPSEGFASDLFVHRSVQGLASLRTSIHSALSQPLTEDDRQRRATQLPIDTAPAVMDDLSRGFGIAGVERYEEMIRCAFESLRQDPSEYRLIRVAMAHPPVPSSLLVEWDLAD